ncbi:hypothetical protein [Streptomyces sp. NPDC056480]|uniref:hypothetical protein n=1 Tax=Streptomyces sp. NPDC056480 TaxID=3345833 RepID=UPI00369E7ABE
MYNERHDERLSDEELELFVQYLHRFANHDVDICLALEAGDTDNPVYVTFCRDCPPVGDASDYRRPFADRRQPTSTADIDDGGSRQSPTAPRGDREQQSDPGSAHPDRTPQAGVAGSHPAGGADEKTIR